MKKILGLDLGTNSIGWALIDGEENRILGMGSRIIPMTQDVLDTFSGGNPLETQTAVRTAYRGVRRLRERTLLRRERLLRVLNVMAFLPEHYAFQIDFEKRLGQFLDEKEPKLAWRQNDDGKFEFIFQQSFNEMIEEFKNNGVVAGDKKIPYDWTIYYLRKKALSQKIEKEELAWILLNFNQKRGYYQLRGEEEEENSNKSVEYYSLKIADVVADDRSNSKGETWYSLHLENGWVYRRSSRIPLFDWKDKTRDFIVTTDLNDDGTVKKDKEGIEKRSFRAPSENDWTLLKKKTEKDIEKSRKTVGAYIYETLLQNPMQKVRGKLVRTVERKFYKDELRQILEKQKEFHSELGNEDLYNDCIRELYRNNETYQLILSKRDFVHLLLNDILFYQRPLRSQKSSISDCALEFQTYKDKDGNEIKEHLKAASKSNPLYQEFRIWQWLYNLRIYRKEDGEDVTAQFITGVEDKEQLFDFLNDRRDVEQKPLLDYLIKAKGLKKQVKTDTYRWNYVEDKAYPCNETGVMISTRLAKVENISDDFLTKEMEQKLWHIIYSVTDKNEFEKALKTFAKKNGLDVVSFVDSFKKFPPFKCEYGAFSEKAIKKLLPLMRLGKYWKWNDIDDNTQNRISKIITGEYDEGIKDIVREKVVNLTNENDFQGLQLWLTQYVVYGRHSEADIAGKWRSVADLEKYLDDFKQHSLRNPIVEQVITETLRVVRDIWKQYGRGAEDFFSEIHVELGRDMKNTADERKRLTNVIVENENTNLRIKALLMELKNNADGKLEIENVRPYSPMQQDILKIYEEGVINSGIEIDEDIRKISKTAQPTAAELQRYRLWLEQKYRSPYTGKVIPLGKLFTEEYQIEHIIPKSRYYDDSLSNKVICEAAVNKLKDKYLGFEFIKNYHGQIVEIGFGQKATIFDEGEYQDFVKRHYAHNHSKRAKLLLEEIPEKMIERQMNDTRYISKFVFPLLSNLVRAEKGDDGVNSKNVLPGNGKITTILKQDWGLNDVWNDLILPRFVRMNKLTGTTAFTSWNEQYQKYLPTVPLDLSKGFQKKRIDHRHHAMDALVIACATRDHINLLNNKHANTDTIRYDLQRKLRLFERVTYTDPHTKEQVTKDIPKEFKKPWDSFTVDARNELGKIVVSFKQNLRIINKATNIYEKYEDGEKVNVKQKGINWAIRKPLHKETVFAKVSLRKIKKVRLSDALKDWKKIVDKGLKQEIERLVCQYHRFNPDEICRYFKARGNQFGGVDISKVDVYYFDEENAAVRKNVDTSFTEKFIRESVTDTGIQKILINHLKAKGDKTEIAFSPEGIEEMNKNIVQLNGGKFHQPILKVRIYQALGNKFQIGTMGNKKDKYVVAEAGTNLFFVVYEKDGKRNYETIPLNEVIEHQKWRGTLSKEEQQKIPVIPIKNDRGMFVFYLSPNDLVYVPTAEQLGDINISVNDIKPNRIYRFTDSSDTRANFIPMSIAEVLFNCNKDKQKKIGIEYSIQNEIGIGSQGSKNQKSINGDMIKDICLKLKIDRLGSIKEISGL
ncbi:type II CRISPR RNA-guided endonuclease Cas9 [Bacteroides timonensis]|uniref:type II CRISPR RNA-guided endonuclease Cas9 n=1 Tax=Bacteroides timonensis TaxID=1470345 RepID=UPI0004B82763|nr:type II CRISPR RNA-guided endonuclease Cas9 [Bacteroides timonensis]